MNLKPKEKGLVEAGIAVGLLLKTAGCHAEYKDGKLTIGTQNTKSNETEKDKKPKKERS